MEETIKTVTPCDEALMLAGINERFDNEPQEVKNLRNHYARIFDQLISIRDSAGRSEQGKAANIAITQARLARSIAVESVYLKGK